jgi:D-aspartate ligase
MSGPDVHMLAAAAAGDDHPQVTPGALIVNGAHVSLGLARSLGRHGIPVWLLADHPLPKFSRFVQRSFSWPGANHADGPASIMEIATQYRLNGWVLFSTGDEDMRMIAQNHALLASRFRVATANWETVQWMYDKRLTYQRAAALGIDCPWTFQPHDLGAVQRLNCRFPVILKPAYHKDRNEFSRAKAWKADSREALVSLYQQAASVGGKDSVIIQEWIPGSGVSQFSYAGLWNRGNEIVSLVARRTRQHPINFGRSSTFVETVEQDQIQKLACRFLKSLNYTGVIEVEFKYDQRDRQYKLLDVNGRFWTWHSLGALAGIDFPYLAWRQALGLTARPARAKTGVAWVHASRDIIAAYQEISRGELTVKDFLAGFHKPLTFANFALDDPLPAILELPVLSWRRVAEWARRTRPDMAHTLSIGSRPHH